MGQVVKRLPNGLYSVDSMTGFFHLRDADGEKIASWASTKGRKDGVVSVYMLMPDTVTEALVGWPLHKLIDLSDFVHNPESVILSAESLPEWGVTQVRVEKALMIRRFA